MSATASTAEAIIPLDPPLLRLAEPVERPREEAEPELRELFDDAPPLLDLDAVPDRELRDDEPDFPAEDRELDPELLPLELELEPELLPLELEPELLLADAEDPDLLDFEAVPLLDDDLDGAAPPDPVPDFEPPDDLAELLFFAVEPPDRDLLVEREELDLEEVEDFDLAPADDDLELDPEDFEPADLDVDDFDPPDLDPDDFDEPAPELEDFLVVAMIFLRIIE